MLIGLFKTLFKWIIQYFEVVRRPSDDLEEIARLKVETNLKIIRSRKSVCEVDAFAPFCYLKYGYVPESYIRQGSQGLGLYDVPIPEFFEDFVHFSGGRSLNREDYDIMSDYESPELIFRGKFLKQKKIAIKKIRSGEHSHLDKEMKIAEMLRNHENIHRHLFGFKLPAYGGTLYVTMENYAGSLLDCGELCHFVDFDVKDIFKQVNVGLKFMHDSQIAHRCLQLRNIVIILRVNTPTYKVTNFGQAIQTSSEIVLKDDVKDLGHLLDSVTIQLDGIVDRPAISDEITRVDLIEKMTRSNHQNRPSMEDVLAHPYLWKTHETLHFVVKIAKLLESKEKAILYQILEKISSKVFTADWRGYIDEHILGELRSINYDKLPMCNVVGLIKTIRNLVRISFRHKEHLTHLFLLP